MPQQKPSAFEQYVRTDRIEHAVDCINTAIVSYVFGTSGDINISIANLTDEQRAEFIAFVAHTIGYDLNADLAFNDFLGAAFNSADGSTSPAHPQPEMDR